MVGFSYSFCLFPKRYLYFLDSFSPHVLGIHHVEGSGLNGSGSQSKKKGRILSHQKICILIGETTYELERLNSGRMCMTVTEIPVLQLWEFREKRFFFFWLQGRGRTQDFNPGVPDSSLLHWRRQLGPDCQSHRTLTLSSGSWGAGKGFVEA